MALINFAWIRMGDGESWLRLPSVILGVAAIILVALWLRRAFGERIALLAACLMALSPVLVHYSQELNQYAAVVFLAVATIVAFERLLQRGSDTDWAVYGVVSVVGLATHFGLAFLLGVLGLYLAEHAWRSGRRRERVRLTAYFASLVAAVAALWMLGLGEGLAVPHLDRRLGGTHLQKEIDYIVDVGWREILVFYLLPFSGGPSLHAVRALSLIAAVGAIALWRLGPAGRRVVGLYFFGPLALTYVASLMGWYPLGYRYGLFAVPALFVGIAAGIDAVWHRSRLAGAVVAVAAGAVFLLFSTHTDARNPWLTVPREALGTVTESMAEMSRPNDLVYVYYGAVPAYGYYGRRERATVLEGRHLDDVGAAQEEAKRIARVAEPGSRVWLVLSHVRGDEGDELLDAVMGVGASGARPELIESIKAENAAAYLVRWP
jgi:mannosyltransferase